MNPTMLAALLIVAVALLLALASRLGWPSSLTLLAGGIAASAVPGLPDGVALDPHVVLGLILPMLLYASIVRSTVHLFREQAIGGLALGAAAHALFVLAIAWIANVMLGLGWPAAVLLGVVLAVADTSLSDERGLGKDAPQAVEAMLAAQGVAGALVLLTTFKLVSAGPEALPTAGEALRQMAWSLSAGLALGAALGWLVVAVRRRIATPTVEVALSAATPLAASALAETTGGSIVLIVVLAALAVSRASVDPNTGETLSAPSARLTAKRFWAELATMLSGVLAFLIGYAATDAVVRVAAVDWTALAGTVVAALAAATAIQLAMAALALRSFRLAAASTTLTGRAPLGLLIALAIPALLPDGTPFAGRDLVVVAAAVAMAISTSLGLIVSPMLWRRINAHDPDGRAAEEAVAANALRSPDSRHARAELVRLRGSGALGDGVLLRAQEALDLRDEARDHSSSLSEGGRS